MGGKKRKPRTAELRRAARKRRGSQSRRPEADNFLERMTEEDMAWLLGRESLDPDSPPRRAQPGSPGWSFADTRRLILEVACPTCGAAAGDGCLGKSGKNHYDLHAARRRLAGV